MEDDKYNLRRFVEAQAGEYPVALSEVRGGRKRSHWMWYIFPQLRQLGYSYNARYFGLSCIAEAQAYLADAVLGPRLREISEAALGLPANDPVEVFGGIDSMKFRSSMTLFDAASPGDVFERVLDKYFGGHRDGRTLDLLNSE